MTIHNAVDGARINNLLNEAQQEGLKKWLGLERCILVGAVARLSHVKGIDILLEAFVLLKGLPDVNNTTNEGACCLPSCEAQGGVRTVLVIVGDGEEKFALRAQATKLGLNAKDLTGVTLAHGQAPEIGEVDIVWLGRRSWQDSIKVMSIFDVCVVPSRFEGFGLSAAEAMACGVAVLAADVDGLPEVVGSDGSSGELFCSQSARDLARVLSELVFSKQKRGIMGLSGRRRVEQMFELGRLQNAVLELYATSADLKKKGS